MIVAYMGEGGASETEFGIAYAWYYAPLASECEDWTQTTIGFHAGDLSCTRVIYKAVP